MADPTSGTVPLANETPEPNNSVDPLNPTDAEKRAICDPEIEMCKDLGVPFKNTIELDYYTPNLYIGILSIAEFLIPYFIDTFYIKWNRSAAVEALYVNNGYFDYGSSWIKNSSFIVWGLPAIFWTIEYFTDNGAMKLLLLIWWGSISTFLAPFSFVIGPFAMLLGLGDWNSAWETAFSKSEIWIWALTSFSFGGAGYYYFLAHWTEALLYYDEVLQERHEEII